MVQSFNYTIFDLGISYRLMYMFAFHHIIIYQGNNTIYDPNAFSKLIFVPLSLSLYVYNNIFTVLAIQIVIISAGGFALFRIVKLKVGSVFFAIILEVVYFLYPSTYGFMAHGGNYQVFIEGFLLLGYMFYAERKMILTIFFFALAAITNIWAPVIILSFLFIEFISEQKLLTKRNLRGLLKYLLLNLKNKAKRRDMILFSFLVFFNIIIFLDTIHFAGGINNLFIYSNVSVFTTKTSLSGFNTSNILNIISNFSSLKLLFLVQIMAPVIFIPIVTPYFLLIFFYLITIWGSSDSAYYSLNQQYPYLFAAFIFIAIVKFFKDIQIGSGNVKILKKLGVVILISSLISFAIYSPFSVTNFQNGTVERQITVSQFDKELAYGLSLIPNNSTVFIQNDLPGLMDKAQVYLPKYYNNQTVDYAVVIPFGFSPVSDAFGGYSPYWAKHFETNDSYGVYEEILGAIVYKLNYTTYPIYFVPVYQSILPGVDNLNGYGTIINNTLIVSNFSHMYGNILWLGGYTSLPAGKYDITFEVMTTNTSNNNSYNQEVWGDYGEVNFTSFEINGSDFSHPYEWENFTISLTLDQYYVGVEFPAFSNSWNGTLEFKGVKISQIAPL